MHVLNPSNDINTFLDFLYNPNDSGYVYAPTKDAESGEFKQDFFKWPEDRSKLVEWINTTTEHAEVYIAPALFSQPSAQKESFKSTNVLWTEFDGNYPESFGDVPSPSLVVQSSDIRHAHCYWRLSEQLRDYKEVEAYNRTLTYSLGADASAWDCNQVLRPPATTNHKRQTVTSISKAFSEAPLPLALFVPTYNTAPVEQFDTTVIPDVTDIIYAYQFPTVVSDLLRSKDLPVGERSTALMRLGFYCAEMGMSDAEIFSVVRNADDRWGKFKGRTDRDKRLLDLISRVREKYPATDYQTDIIPVFGFQSFLEHEIHVEWVIDGLLQEQGYLLLSGPSGIGKTQFTLRFVMQMCLGRDYLGEKVNRPRKIVVFSLEMAHADLKYFVEIMARDYSDEDKALLEENLIFVPYGEPIYLNTDEGRQQFTDIIEAIQPDGIIVDSLGSTTTGGLSNEDTVKAIVDFNDKIRKKYGIFTWFIHHMRKASGDNKKPNKLDDVYGNQYIVNRATTVLCLWPNKSGDNKIDVIPLKIRLGAKRDTWTIQRIGNLQFEKTASVNIVTMSQMISDDTHQGPTTGTTFGDI